MESHSLFKGLNMKKLIVGFSVLILASCGPIKVQNVPSDDQITKVAEVVNNQGQALQEIIKILQEKKIIVSPEEKK